jgi:hypothetical protein
MVFQVRKAKFMVLLMVHRVPSLKERKKITGCGTTGKNGSLFGLGHVTPDCIPQFFSTIR